MIKHQDGGKVKLYDGNYLKVGKLTKDLIAGRSPIGIYKGKKMYLNGNGVAGPSYNGKLATK